jgi:hypothetical protein
MRKIIRVCGVISAVVAAILGLLTALSWPPGGLMFAMPYFFLFPGVIFACVGIVLIIATRKKKDGD